MNIAPITPALLALSVSLSAAHADCVDDAAAHHGVNPLVLRAIGWHESRLRPDAVARNANGSVDIGAFQINSIHLGRLSAYGIQADALRNGCVSAYVGAWHYRQQVSRHGNSWRAVGAYHSNTPARSAWYANAIAAVLMKWKVAPAGPLPYAASLTLAPGHPSSRSVRTLPGTSAQPVATAVYDPGATQPDSY